VDSCKRISQLVSAGLDRKLSASERLRVRLHLLFCRHCRIVERQLMAIRGFVKRLAGAAKKEP
jgi:hypothetical protein